MPYPSRAELLAAVQEFNEQTDSDDENFAYLSGVALNAAKIVERELQLRPALEVDEAARLKELLNLDGELAVLNARLCELIRTRAVNYLDPLLLEHVRKTALAQLSFENPKYSTYRALS